MKTLYDVSVGDNVFYSDRYNIYLLKVTRLTPKTIICDSRKFNKDTGYEKGAGNIWSQGKINVLTPENLQLLELLEQRKNLVRLIDQLNIDSLTIDEVRDISNLIKTILDKHSND